MATEKEKDAQRFKTTEQLIDSETMEVLSSTSKDWSFQNRDVIKWMNRIEIGATYKGEAKKILKSVGRIVSEVSCEVFSQHWANAIPSHERPSNVKVDSDVKSPVIKKLHADGDSDEHFIYYKDYPFYYVWNVFDVFTFTPSAKDGNATESAFKEWYAEKLSASVNDEMLRLVKREIGKDYVELFAFPKGKDDFVENKINLVFSSSVKFNGKQKQTTHSLFKTSADYADMIIHELSMAMGRILQPNVMDGDNDGYVPDNDAANETTTVFNKAVVEVKTAVSNTDSETGADDGSSGN